MGKTFHKEYFFSSDLERKTKRKKMCSMKLIVFVTLLVCFVNAEGEQGVNAERMKSGVEKTQALLALKSLARLKALEGHATTNAPIGRFARSLCDNCDYCHYCDYCPCSDNSYCQYCSYCGYCDTLCCFPCLLLTLRSFPD